MSQFQEKYGQTQLMSSESHKKIKKYFSSDRSCSTVSGFTPAEEIDEDGFSSSDKAKNGEGRKVSEFITFDEAHPRLPSDFSLKMHQWMESGICLTEIDKSSTFRGSVKNVTFLSDDKLVEIIEVESYKKYNTIISSRSDDDDDTSKSCCDDACCIF